MKKVLSLALLVAVGAFIVFMTGCEPPGELAKPTGLQAEGTTDGKGIKLTWSPVTDAETYDVYFDGELLLEEIEVTEYSHADPGKVGEYTVIAVAGSDESPESDPLSTAPTAAVTLDVDEINGAEKSGIGWSQLGTGTITAYTMGDESDKEHVYFYYTDWALGSSDAVDLARALEVENDAGVTWEVGTGWNDAGVSLPLADAFDDVTEVAFSGIYDNYNTPTENATQAVVIKDAGGDYYGLIETVDITAPSISCRVKFQKIKNFVLFK